MKPSLVTFGDFYVPHHKYELVDYLTRLYPRDRNKLDHKLKKELYAMYYRIRRAE